MPRMLFELDARPATDAETTEALERSPGARPLVDRGWTPVWVEARTSTEEHQDLELDRGVVWREPGAPLQAFLDEQVEQHLAAHLERSGDIVDAFEVADVPPEAIVVRADGLD